jgi:hypothetical protein
MSYLVETWMVELEAHLILPLKILIKFGQKMHQMGCSHRALKKNPQQLSLKLMQEIMAREKEQLVDLTQATMNSWN